MNNTALKRTGLVLISALCTMPLHAATPAGKVVYAFGKVEAVQADGQARVLARGDVFGPGDSVVTHNGRVQLRFSDGGYAALQPHTTYRVEDYHFEGQADGRERSFLNLVHGSVRLVTGIIGRYNKQNFRLRTSVATIGIRGTSGKVSHCESNCGERGPGTSLAGYGGEWDLNSGTYSGPVKPGQATFCNGASCFDIPGFGQRRDVAASGATGKEEADEVLDEDDGSRAGATSDQPFRDGEQADTSGVNCNIGGRCGADLLVAQNLVGADANTDPNRGSGDTGAFDNVSVVLNNGMPVAAIAVEPGGNDPHELPIGLLTVDGPALRQALLDFGNPAISALGLKILDAVPLIQRRALAARPATVGVGDFGRTRDHHLLHWRWQNGLVLEIDSDFSGTVVSSGLIDLRRFQSEHFIVGADPGPLPNNVLASYQFTGGTFSTAVDGSSIGQGVIGGTLQFDFSLGSGNLHMNVRHAGLPYQVLAGLQLNNVRFFSEVNGVAIRPGGTHPVEIDGFFAAAGPNAPLAAGLSYLIKSPLGIVGVAGFGLDNAMPVTSMPAAVNAYVAFAHNYTSMSSTLASQAFDFLVGGSNGALLNDNVVTSFSSISHPGLCSPACTFNSGPAPFARDPTGPASADRNLALGISWARFAPGYAIQHADVQIPQGSAHVLKIDIPTALANIPAVGSGQTGTYNLIRGGTRPTVIFETGAVQQGEIIGDLSAASMTILFNSGDISANLSGSFPAAGGTGTWNLAGSNISVCPGGGDCFNRADGIHALALNGSVSSAAITNPGASQTTSGGPGCALTGHTHFDVAGINATAVAGSYQASTQASITPAFSLSGTYVLEGTVTP